LATWALHAEWAEEGAHIEGEKLWLFERGETAGRHFDASLTWAA
jgi:hypothetical protein